MQMSLVRTVCIREYLEKNGISHAARNDTLKLKRRILRILCYMIKNFRSCAGRVETV